MQQLSLKTRSSESEMKQLHKVSTPLEVRNHRAGNATPARILKFCEHGSRTSSICSSLPSMTYRETLVPTRTCHGLVSEESTAGRSLPGNNQPLMPLLTPAWDTVSTQVPSLRSGTGHMYCCANSWSMREPWPLQTGSQILTELDMSRQQIS